MLLGGPVVGVDPVTLMVQVKPARLLPPPPPQAPELGHPDDDDPEAPELDEGGGHVQDDDELREGWDGGGGVKAHPPRLLPYDAHQAGANLLAAELKQVMMTNCCLPALPLVIIGPLPDRLLRRRARAACAARPRLTHEAARRGL